MVHAKLEGMTRMIAMNGALIATGSHSNLSRRPCTPNLSLILVPARRSRMNRPTPGDFVQPNLMNYDQREVCTAPCRIASFSQIEVGNTAPPRTLRRRTVPSNAAQPSPSCPIAPAGRRAAVVQCNALTLPALGRPNAQCSLNTNSLGTRFAV